MNRHPPQSPDERLDAEERALAALLPRPHGRGEPGPELDARILAAAHAATQPARATPTAPRRRSWIAPTALAASLMLAVGLAWQLRPPQSLRTVPAEAASASADADSDADAMAVRAFEAPPAGASDEASAAQPRPTAMVPPPAERPAPAGIANAPVAPAATARQESAPVPPPPPPAPVAPVVLESPPVAAPMPAPQATESARMAAPAMAKAARAGDAVRERASTSGIVAAPARDEAQRAADATTLDTVTIPGAEAAEPEEPEEEVPPATADSPDVRDAWLRRIGELLKQGKTADAKASLDEFRRRYPDAPIPPELRKLER